MFSVLCCAVLCCSGNLLVLWLLVCFVRASVVVDDRPPCAGQVCSTSDANRIDPEFLWTNANPEVEVEEKLSCEKRACFCFGGFLMVRSRLGVCYLLDSVV